MESAKEEVIQLIRQLPDDTTLEEIQYHLYVQQKVRRGMRDVEEGRVGNWHVLKSLSFRKIEVKPYRLLIPNGSGPYKTLRLYR